MSLNPSLNRKALKAARLYLEMRGFKVIEQSWSSGRNRIDLIASKDDQIHFVELSLTPEDTSQLQVPNLVRSKMVSLQAAALAWLNESKYDGKFIFTSLDLALPNYSVIGFNEDIY